MSTRARRFFSADTLERACVEAAAYYGLRPEELAYSVREKRHGFLKVRRRVVIEIDPQAPRRPDTPAPAAAPSSQDAAPSEPRRQPSPAARPAPTAGAADLEGDRAPAEDGFVHLPESPRRRAETLAPAQGETVTAARQAVEEISRFLGAELAAELFEAEEALEIELSGPDQEILLEDDGEMLRAIQHMVPRLMRGLGVEPVAVKVDCDNFLEIREERLRHLAQSTAERVKKTGRPALLEPLNPGERRIVHLTLSADAAVVTESQGEGFMKRIVIRPQRMARDR